MTRKGKLIAAATVVAVAALLIAGTSYARSPAEQGEAVAGWECGDVAAVDIHSTMWASLAEGLGVTTDQLDKALAQGRSPEELAKEKGISPEQLAEKMVAATKAAVDKQVTTGALSREQADSLLNTAREHMRPEHVASMFGMTGAIHGRLSADGAMASMHESMEGVGDPSGESCHEGEFSNGMMGPEPSMMGQRF